MRRPTTARRGLATAALALALGLALAACAGGKDDASPAPSDSASSAATEADVAAVAAISVTGDPGDQPVVTLPTTPFAVSSSIVRVVEPGTGAPLSDGQQLAIRSVIISGASGSVLASTYPAAPDTLLLNTDLGMLHDTLVGAHVGVRVVIAVAASADDPATQVTALEVVDATTLPGRASGTPVTPPPGLPTVTLAHDGRPTITRAAGPAPTTLVAQPLILGTGAPVTAAQTLTVHYALSLWDGTAVQSTWEDSRTAQFPLDSVLPGWQEGLIGQPIGSQILLVVPPAMGYGSKASDSIPAGSTLVYVVDILAAS